MNGTDTKLKGNVLPFSHKVTELPRKSQVTVRPAWLEDGRPVTNTRGLNMDIARLRESLSRLNSAELKLVLEFAKFLKRLQDNGLEN